jgi:hypothetical protein
MITTISSSIMVVVSSTIRTNINSQGDKAVVFNRRWGTKGMKLTKGEINLREGNNTIRDHATINSNGTIGLSNRIIRTLRIKVTSRTREDGARPWEYLESIMFTGLDNQWDKQIIGTITRVRGSE